MTDLARIPRPGDQQTPRPPVSTDQTPTGKWDIDGVVSECGDIDDESGNRCSRLARHVGVHMFGEHCWSNNFEIWRQR